MKKRSNCELAIDILRATNDGNDLAPEHLKLLEIAVNCPLGVKALQSFRRLHREVTSGTYARPWLQGVEHLTRDHNGYVSWKGLRVDHWSGNLPHTEKGKDAALELARRCEIIESRGEVPDTTSVIWKWEEGQVCA